MTQAALAATLGFEQTDISKVERGARRLDVLELRAWLRALSTGLSEFMVDLDERLANLEALSRHKRSGKAGQRSGGGATSSE